MTAEERIAQLEMELARERAKTARVEAELALERAENASLRQQMEQVLARLRVLPLSVVDNSAFSPDYLTILRNPTYASL